MYYYKNGKKQKYVPKQENYKPVEHRMIDNRGQGRGPKRSCPTMWLGILAVLALIVAVWLVYCIMNDKKV